MGVKGPRGVELLQGERITLAASAARKAADSANGTAFGLDGERFWYSVMLIVTNKATDANDTCDVYIDFLGPDGVTWLNAVHFTQLLGNGADAEKQYALLIANSGSTAPTVVTSDAASGVIRPEVTGSQIRARWAIVDGGADNDESFTFAVYAWAM